MKHAIKNNELYELIFLEEVLVEIYKINSDKVKINIHRDFTFTSEFLLKSYTILDNSNKLYKLIM